MRNAWRKTGFALLLGALLGMAGLANAVTCQFNQASGVWNLPANWNGCGAGNGIPAGTPGPADRAEVLSGSVANLPAGVFTVAALYLQGGIVQGVGPGVSVINTGPGLFTPWGAGPNVLNGITLNLGAGAGIDSSAGAFNLNSSEFVTNSGTSIIGLLNASGVNAKVKMTGGTAYHAIGDQNLLGGAEFENQSGVFKAIGSITVNGPFKNSGNIEIPAGITLALANAAAMTQLDPVFSLIFGDGVLSAPGQVLTLATGGVRGGALTFNVGTLNNTGAVVRAAPSFGTTGVLTINGNYTQSGSGLLDFNLGGLAPSQYDRLVVSGTATLGGGTSRGSINGFSPPVGTVLDLITAGAVSGTFSSGSEAIVFNAPRRYSDVYTATKYSVQASSTVWVVGSNDDASPMTDSLRNALLAFNAETGSGCVNAPYSIHFFLPMGSETISPMTPLPAISGCPGLLIDGYTQSGASPNSAPGDFNGVTPVVLDGSLCSSCNGLTALVSGVNITGLRMTGWHTAIVGSAAAYPITITGNVITNGANGIAIAAPSNAQIGGSVVGRNVITGQSSHGILISSGAMSAFAAPAPSVNLRAVETDAEGRSTSVAGDAGGSASGKSGEVERSARMKVKNPPVASQALVSLPHVIDNNMIGVAPGLVAAPNQIGIFVDDINGVTIRNNLVKHSFDTGIVVNNANNVDFIQNNIIAFNSNFGVDLGWDDASANDDAAPPYDTDTGPNLRLNYPKPLNFTMTTANSGQLNYELKSTASSNFDVCFCRNASGSDQCEQPVACTPVSTDATGLFTGSFGLGGLGPGYTVTMLARATSGPKTGNVSETSPAINFVAAAPAISVTGTTSFPATNVGSSAAVQTITITNTGAANLTLNTITNSNPSTFYDTRTGPSPNPAHYCGFGSSAANVPLTAAPIVIPPMGTCQLVLAFTPGAAGALSGNITILSDAPTSPTVIALTGTGVAPLPTVAMSVVSSNIPVNGGTNLVITLGNSGATLDTISAGSMTLPVGIIVDTPPATTTCVGGSVMALAQTITISGGVIPAMGTCTVTVPVRGITPGVYTLNFAAGALTTSRGMNAAAASAGLTVIALANPTLNVAFAPTSVATSTNATLTITINNPGIMATSISLGSGVTTSGLTLSGLVDGCSIGAFISGGVIDFGMAGTLSASSTCTITVQAQAAMPGSYTVNVAAGNLVTFPAGNNTNTSSATLTVAAAGPSLAYISNLTSNNVSVINTVTNTVVATIPVGSGPSGVVVNPAGTRAYVTNGISGDVSVIDTSSNTVIATVPTGAGARSVAVNPAGTRAYVVNFTPNNVSVIDTATNTVIATVPVGLAPLSVATHPSGTRAYVGNQNSQNVSVIDTATNAVVATIPIGGVATGLALHPNGSRLFVARPGASTNDILMIDTANNTVVNTVSSGAASTNDTQFLALNLAGTRIYAANQNSGTVTVVDSTSGALITTINVGSAPHGVAFNVAGNRAYVANRNTNDVSVVDTTTNTVVATVPVGSEPFATGIFIQRAVGPLTPPSIFSAAPAGGNVGAAYSHTFTANGTGPIDWSVSSGALPTGLTLNPLTGLLSGVPTLTGSSTFTVQAFNGVAPSATQTVTLVIAPAPAPAVTLSGTALSFGNQTVSVTSASQLITLTNSGAGSLTISSITATGDYGFTSTCPILTPPIASMAPPCNISITFTPLGVGVRAGAISIASNAPGSPHVISLTGNGTPIPVPVIGVSATSIAFGSGLVGAVIPQRSVVVSNTGLATLNFSSITVTGAGFSRVLPAIASPADCGASLAPLASCRIAVQCIPPALGPLTGQLNLFHNAAGSPTVLSLTCDGVPLPVSSIALPGNVDFGDQILAVTSTAQTISVTNSGTAVLNVSGLSLGGANPADFAFSGRCDTVSPGIGCPLVVTFTPRALGARDAVLNVASDAPNAASVNAIRLHGNGIVAPRPLAALDLTAVGFGNTIFAGATPSQTVMLRNDGGLALNLSAIVATGDFLASHNCGSSVPPQGSCQINVQFLPAGMGSRSGELQVFSNAASSPNRVSLTGTGCRWFSQASSRFFLVTCSQ